MVSMVMYLNYNKGTIRHMLVIKPSVIFVKYLAKETALNVLLFKYVISIWSLCGSFDNMLNLY